ncbi:MAG TPA: HAD family hydrolase [Candidatus Nanoarchaeia archaeon]|nr:HAD family hydrolase [Candidatus Nanoarchaeia archaeon]
MAIVIGFDLDQTLYPKSPLIDEAIQSYIYGVIAKRKQIPLDEARKLFLAQYPTISGRKTLLLLGFDDAEQIIQESLERAEIEPFLKPDPEVLDLLCELQQTYGGLTLITGSSAEIARRKLSKLGLPVSLFSVMITGEVSKSDGTAFRIWMAQEQAKNPALNASDFLYVGDRPSTDVEIPASLGMRSVLVNVKKIDVALKVPQLGSLLELRHYLSGEQKLAKIEQTRLKQ